VSYDHSINSPTECQPPRASRRSRLTTDLLGVAAAFALTGVIAGAWASRIPWVKEHLDLSAGRLGLALLMPAIGGVVAMPVVGRIIARHGSRVVTLVTVPAWCLTLGLPALAPSFAVLLLALVAYGVSAGAVDVAINAQATLLERRRGRVLLPTMHGLWSVGALVGGLSGATANAIGVGAPAHLAVVAVLLLVLAWLALPGLPAGETPRPPPLPTAGARSRGRAAPGLLAVGLMGLAALFVEAAITDWSAVYVAISLGAGPVVGAIAYSAFATAMAVGRLSGSRVLAAWGPVRVLRRAALMATGGLLLAVSGLGPLVAVVGFAAAGLGLACAVPIVFGTAAARHGHGDPGPSIAFVATMSYPGWLAAPAAIGALADATSLRLSLLLTASLGLLMAAGARVVATGAEPDPQPASPTERR
jgi:fucose permease